MLTFVLDYKQDGATRISVHKARVAAPNDEIRFPSSFRMVIYAARRTRTSLRRPHNFVACLSLLSLTRERANDSLVRIRSISFIKSVVSKLQRSLDIIGFLPTFFPTIIALVEGIINPQVYLII